MCAKMSDGTPYYIRMMEVIVTMRGQGRTAFTPAQLAESMERQVTSSMRRNLTKMTEVGWLKPFRFYTERGGLALGYEILEPLNPHATASQSR